MLASKLLGHALMSAGYDVKLSEVHGMAQRGGSVVTQVRFGEKVYSPIISEGEVDFLLAFEPLEALRWSHMLSERGKMITDTYQIYPSAVNMGLAEYPDAIAQLGAVNPLVVQAADIGTALGNWRVANVVMLGVLSKMLPIDQHIWEQALKEIIPKKHYEINRRAFSKGQSLV